MKSLTHRLRRSPLSLMGEGFQPFGIPLPLGRGSRHDEWRGVRFS